MNWFEEWFDSPLYEKLYVNRDESEALQLIELLEETLSLHACSHILDLGCGRGRHAINLARKGYQVTGIDLSVQAIQTAQEKVEQLNLQNVDFQVRDMRNPLPQTFDAIVNLFTTFGYFMADKENARVLDSVVQMLKPGGIFVLDYLNARKVRTSFDSSDAGKFHDIDYNIKRYLKNDAIYKDIHFMKEETGAQKTYSERVKLYELDWFEREMDKRCLKIDHVYGDYQGGYFDPESSPRMLIISHLKADDKQE
ncbi:MAG: class I SAM-dependent methyltransferase [Balneolaceae bacterium]|nr:class I SAM-dependent methyltransferase [Balneolaceae bacterium]